jgi:hypothetical protein
VIDLTSTEDPEQRVIHDTEQAIVEQAGDTMLTALDRLDDLLVTRRLLTLPSPRHQAESGTNGTFGA